MSSPAFEAFLARLYTDGETRQRFLAEPRAVAQAAGLVEAECEALERIDRDGLVLAAEMEGRTIETVEGLALGNELHPLQRTFADLGAAQCGYCTPGILMAAKALLAENGSPTTREIETALAGNLCRCTGYHKIVQAVAWAAAILRGDGAAPPEREWLYGAEEPGG